jgi:serine/threonine-protein kinase
MPGRSGKPATFPPPSHVDATLDDELPPPRAPTTSAPRVRTEFGEPVELPASAPFQPTLESPVAPPTPHPSSHPPSQPPSRPISTVETTLSDEEAAVLHRRSRMRAIVVVGLCFFLSVVITATVLVRMGYIGPSAGLGTLNDQVTRADNALKQKRWDAPPGDNVRDLTNEGLAKWPNDPRLIEVRAHATDELVKEAVGLKFSGDLAGALHLAKLANELDPSDTTAQHLLEEYQQESKQSEQTTPPALLDAALVPSHPPTNPRVQPPPGPTSRVALDAAPGKPHLGQPVAFVARITTASGSPPKVIEDVHFQLSGPGLAPDTRLSAMNDGPGVYRTAFTFFESGKFDVSFDARVDGVLIRAVRAVVAGDDAPQGPPQPPPPTPGGKWL